jgi:Uma2 family endonuclease
MNTAEKGRMVSIEEYLAYDASIEGKAEYYDGEVLCKALVSPDHCLIAANVGSTIGSQLRGSGTHAYAGGLRFFVPEKNAFVYPDLSVISGDRQYAPMDRNTLENPVVVVEVISPDSEVLDRIRKFDCYWAMPSLREYVLIEQDRMQVDVILRMAEAKWLTIRYTQPGDEVKLESLGIAIPVENIYDGVEFQALES